MTLALQQLACHEKGGWAYFQGWAYFRETTVFNIIDSENMIILGCLSDYFPI